MKNTDDILTKSEYDSVKELLGEIDRETDSKIYSTRIVIDCDADKFRRSLFEVYLDSIEQKKKVCKKLEENLLKFIKEFDKKIEESKNE